MTVVVFLGAELALNATDAVAFACVDVDVMEGDVVVTVVTVVAASVLY